MLERVGASEALSDAVVLGFVKRGAFVSEKGRSIHTNMARAGTSDAKKNSGKNPTSMSGALPANVKLKLGIKRAKIRIEITWVI